MDWEQILRDFIVGVSVFSAGLALYLVWINAQFAWEHRKVWDVVRGKLAYSLAFLGYAIVVLTVVEAVLLPIQTLPFTRQVFQYGIGLLFAFFGFIGIADDHRHRKKKVE